MHLAPLSRLCLNWSAQGMSCMGVLLLSLYSGGIEFSRLLEVSRGWWVEPFRLAALLGCLAGWACCQTESEAMRRLLDRVLTYEGHPTLAPLTPPERVTVVEELRVLQSKAKGPQRNAAAFVLTLLGVEKRKNRDLLVEALKGCRTRVTYCDEDTAGFVMELYRRGDRALLSPLVEAGVRADGALAEGLAAFYGELLTQDARLMVSVLRQRPSSEQDKVCELAATGVPQDKAQEIQTVLAGMRGKAAGRCLSGFRDGLRLAKEKQFD